LREKKPKTTLFLNFKEGYQNLSQAQIRFQKGDFSDLAPSESGLTVTPSLLWARKLQKKKKKKDTSAVLFSNQT
jgi:hypothetical protein